ncbi:MAG: hypothetical protein LUD81_09500 [Clostridiales bacterium]|nr:hypothetical protein [Clostridiales bacterium]
MENIYYIIMLFLIYSFLGWVLEVSYSAVKKGRLINRGFLNGAWCPIYGAGALMILYMLYPLEDNIPLLFAGSLILTSFLEFLTGFVLKKNYNTRWWDYSDRHFNIKGYVCLECSLVWGAAGVLLVKVLNPVISGLVLLLPLWAGVSVAAALSAVFAVDCVITVLALNNLCSQIEGLGKIAAEIRSVSDELSVTVYEGASELKEIKETGDSCIKEFKETSETKLKEFKETNETKLKEFRETNETRLKELRKTTSLRSKEHREALEARKSELKKKYKFLLNERKFCGRHLLTAFPDVKTEKHQLQLEKLKKKYLKRGDSDV